MKTLYLLFSLSIAAIIAISGIQSSNGKAGKTKSPGETSCAATNCHDDFSENDGVGSVTFSSDIPVTGYVAATTYHCTLTVARTGSPLFGFGVEALRANDTINAGTFVITEPTKSKILNISVNSKQRANVVQLADAGLNPDFATWAFDWTAPSSDSGTIVFYYAGLAADNTGNTAADYVYFGSTMAFSVGISEKFAQSNNLTVSPNPSHDNFTVHFATENNSEVNFSILDLRGRNVYTFPSKNYSAGKNLENFSLPANLDRGIYFLMMNNGENKKVQKISIL